jgi:hypothetical protein
VAITVQYTVRNTWKGTSTIRARLLDIGIIHIFTISDRHRVTISTGIFGTTTVGQLPPPPLFSAV